MAKTWGVSFCWLLTGDGDGNKKEGPSHVVDIPLVGDAVAAGAPIVPYDQVESTIPVPRKMLRSTDPGRLLAVRVAGDSMEPVLRKGDIVVVDRSKCSLRELRGKIVVARVDDGIVVKYLDFDPRAGHTHVSLASHNARKYHAIIRSAKEVEEAVVGKVVLVIGEIK